LIDDIFIGAHLEKAKTLEELNRLEEAIEYYRLTMELDTETPFAFLRIGKCYEGLGDLDQALDYYNKTVNEDPLLDKGWLALTDIYMKKGKLDQALKNIKKALGIDEELPDYWNKLGEIYVRLNQLEAAAGSFQKSIALDPEQLEVHLSLADVLLISKEKSEALLVLKEAKEIFRSDAEILFRIAGLNYQLGNKERSFYYLEKALLVNADYQVILHELFPDFYSSPRVQKLIAKHKK
jgi:tetratricopeptide (TPR) repeat protein